MIFAKLFEMFNHLLVVGHIGYNFPQTEVSIRFRSIIIAVTKAVAAMPKQPTPPTIHFRYWIGTSFLISEYLTVFVFYVLVSSIAVTCLKIFYHIQRCSSYSNHIVQKYRKIQSTDGQIHISESMYSQFTILPLHLR